MEWTQLHSCRPPVVHLAANENDCLIMIALVALVSNIQHIAPSISEAGSPCSELIDDTFLPPARHVATRVWEGGGM